MVVKSSPYLPLAFAGSEFQFGWRVVSHRDMGDDRIPAEYRREG